VFLSVSTLSDPPNEFRASLTQAMLMMINPLEFAACDRSDSMSPTSSGCDLPSYSSNRDSSSPFERPFGSLPRSRIDRGDACGQARVGSTTYLREVDEPSLII
jgi:hypothetical protein